MTLTAAVIVLLFTLTVLFWVAEIFWWSDGTNRPPPSRLFSLLPPSYLGVLETALFMLGLLVLVGGYGLTVLAEHVTTWPEIVLLFIIGPSWPFTIVAGVAELDSRIEECLEAQRSLAARRPPSRRSAQRALRQQVDLRFSRDDPLGELMIAALEEIDRVTRLLTEVERRILHQVKTIQFAADHPSPPWVACAHCGTGVVEFHRDHTAHYLGLGSNGRQEMLHRLIALLGHEAFHLDEYETTGTTTGEERANAFMSQIAQKLDHGG